MNSRFVHCTPQHRPLSLNQRPNPTPPAPKASKSTPQPHQPSYSQPPAHATVCPPPDACADYCISLFSDLTRYVTMQNLMHDGGFSTTGISAEIVEMMTKAAGVE